MINQIALYTIFGLPIVVYGGILTLLAFLFTAFIGFTNYKHLAHHLPFAWHIIVFIASLIIALIHMFFALSIYIGY